VLEFDQLEIEINGRPLLRLNHLALKPGQIVAMHGPSGCGKTTLLRSIAGLIDPRSGSIRLLAKTPEQWGWPNFRRSMPLVAQVPVVHDDTVEQNLRLPFRYRANNERSFDPVAAAKLLNALGLDPSILNQQAGTLSIGEQQRLCLIRALLLNPVGLLLDEPSSALDDASADRLRDLLLDQAETHNHAILMATHRTEWTQGWCHRAIQLEPIPKAHA